MNVVLMGMKHCGKSTIGQILADRWLCTFQDVDQLIEQTHREQTHEELSVREIYARHGEQRFVDLDAQVVQLLLAQKQRTGAVGVVALGGRTALNPAHAHELHQLGLCVYLTVDVETLWQRVERGGIPPFLDVNDPHADFLRLCRQRAPYYEQLADVTVAADANDPHRDADAVEHAIGEHELGR